MKFPGGFLERTDFPIPDNDRYDLTGFGQNNLFSFIFNTTSNEVIQHSCRAYDFPLHLFPWRSNPFNYYERTDYSKLILEAIIYLKNLDLWFQVTEENVIARLRSSWAQYSYATVKAVNDFLDGKRDKEKRAFIKQYAICNWSKCKKSGLFVPTKLKVYDATFGGPAYFISQQGGLSQFNDRLVIYLSNRLGYSTSQTRGVLYNYTTKATDYLTFLKDTKEATDIFYGLELEYENRTIESTEKTKELLKDYAILKRDGSVSGGFEICSAPAAFQIHKDKLQEFFKYLPTSGLTAESNTGMHVHISRAPLSFLQLGKIFALLNNEENEELLTKIAGRVANSYCRRNNVTNMISFPWRRPNGESRYSRLNLENNATIELRMFSTPITYENFMHKLEFCKAIIDVTSPAASTTSVREFKTIDVLTQHVSKQHKNYPHLAKLIGV